MPAPTRALAAAAVAVALLVAAIGGLALSAADPAAPAASATERAPDDLQALHAAGTTGENVTVGVVDVTGFDTDHPRLSGRVVDARAFGPGATVDNGGRTRHGTAAAAIVAQTAPDAGLRLASFDTQSGFRRAVTWLLGTEVDVIVAPVSFYGTAGDGESTVARLGEWARSQGVVFVAPTGNLARGHWRGTGNDIDGDRLQFGDSTRNYLAGRGSRARIWLSWDRPGVNYTAELYRDTGAEPALVARSQPYLGDDLPNARIAAQLEGGAYFLTVRSPDGPTNATLRLSSPTHRLQRTTAERSLTAPATGRGVVGVGAYEVDDERVAPFSSRGPTADGRLGVDLVAPARHAVAGDDEPLVGSSAAAPYAGGVAALVLDSEPGLSPREVEFRLERTAVDVGPSGTDATAGHGLVAPGRAVDAVNASG